MPPEVSGLKHKCQRETGHPLSLSSSQHLLGAGTAVTICPLLIACWAMLFSTGVENINSPSYSLGNRDLKVEASVWTLSADV